MQNSKKKHVSVGAGCSVLAHSVQSASTISMDNDMNIAFPDVQSGFAPMDQRPFNTGSTCCSTRFQPLGSREFREGEKNPNVISESEWKNELQSGSLRNFNVDAEKFRTDSDVTWLDVNFVCRSY